MALTPEERRALEDVIYADERRKLADRFLAPLFGLQRTFIADRARRKALFCSRRAGKTTLAPRRILLNAVEMTGTLQRFFAISRMRAKELIWEDGKDSLKRVNYELQIGARFNETELSVRLPNESLIRLTGADKLGEAQKKVGDKLAMAALDEAQLYPDNVLKSIVDDIAGPALEDLDGVLELYGTPGKRCTGMWWDITRDDGEERAADWSVHSWTVLDNPAFPRWAGRSDWRLVAREWLQALKEKRGWSDTHPTYMTEWCGRWSRDTGDLVYAYDPARNGFDGILPPLPPGARWMHTAGSDLGKKDAFSIVVWAFCPAIVPAFEVFSSAESYLTVEQWEERWESCVKTFHPYKIRVDTAGYGGMIIESIQKRRATTPGKVYLPLESAEKHDKRANQKLMNDDLLATRLMVNRHGVLAGEMSILPKDPDNEEKEDERYANHACDGGLYGYRDLSRLHFKPRDEKEEDEKPQAFKADTYKARITAKMQANKEKPWWDRSKR